MSRLAFPKPRRGRTLFWLVIALAALALVGIIAIALMNAAMLATKDRIVSAEQAADYPADAVLVLGCGVRADGSPSDMLHDRVTVGTDIFKAGATAPLLMSGDSEHPDEYDETKAMVSLATKLGIDPANIAVDPLGLSTYDSLVRAKEEWNISRIVIVTQEYHLYRALYIAEQLGLEAIGVPADLRSYRGQSVRELREIAARCKDFLQVQFH